MIKWINSLNIFKYKSEFDKTFEILLRYEKSGLEGSKRLYNLLKLLNNENDNELIDELIMTLNKISFTSNTNDWFYFYFPIVSHILYFVPNKQSEILGYLVGPNFANGIDKTDKMVEIIQGAMKFKLKENQNYLTSEGKQWIANTLPLLSNEVKREINKCIEELNA